MPLKLQWSNNKEFFIQLVKSILMEMSYAVMDEERKGFLMNLLVRAGVEINPGPGTEQGASPKPNKTERPPPSDTRVSIAANIAAAIKSGTKKRRGRPRSSGAATGEGGDVHQEAVESECECGRTFTSKKYLVQHHKFCPAKNKPVPVSPLIKRRQTPSPMKTPKSAGAKFLKVAPATPKTTHSNVGTTTYVQDHDTEILLSSCKYMSSI